jgi:hypothetical protein
VRWLQPNTSTPTTSPAAESRSRTPAQVRQQPPCCCPQPARPRRSRPRRRPGRCLRSPNPPRGDQQRTLPRVACSKLSVPVALSFRK